MPQAEKIGEEKVKAEEQKKKRNKFKSLSLGNRKASTGRSTATVFYDDSRTVKVKAEKQKKKYFSQMREIWEQ